MRSLQSELVRNGLLQARTGEVERKSTRTNNKRKERLSDKELRELMGANRATYGRVKGRVKQR
ncbi:hypothetical protein MKY34_19720 [Sporosarcina sp. FSL K6-1522]|uniref:hypothetical protein n=1 Tax=Sporosarcina sp. FSL K6-1522 TaxID=2921554 RepID=UPI00315A1EFF